MQGLAEADVGLFVIDARSGVTAADQDLADELRRQNKPVLLVANKCEGRVAESQLGEAWALGLGEPLPVSAEHGDGIPDLCWRMRALSAARGRRRRPGRAAEPAEAEAAPRRCGWP